VLDRLSRLPSVLQFKLWRQQQTECHLTTQMRDELTLEPTIPPTCHITIGACTLRVTAAVIWNGLPPDVIMSPSLSVLKRQLKTILFCHSSGV